MRRDLTVACVLRSGGDFDAEYVIRLQAGVARHLTLPHRFVCLSDVPVPCERFPLVAGWPGWWSKLELFAWLRGPTLFFDLDTVLVGSIDELAAHPHRFSMLSDFGYPAVCSSAVMAWDGDWSHLATRFRRSMMDSYCEPRRWGDQGYIAEHAGVEPDRLQALFPRQIVSYKFGTRHPGVEVERVVCFHGLPRPRDVGWSV